MNGPKGFEPMKPLALLALALLGFSAARAAEAPCAGCTYHFMQLMMPSDRFRRSMVPLFDEQLSFDAFTDYLDQQRIFYSLSDICMGAGEFPQDVQKILAGFGPGDNLIGKSGGSVLILKIQRLHPSRQACLADLPARSQRETGAKRPPRGTNTRAPSFD
jgi:hypothetical protein